MVKKIIRGGKLFAVGMGFVCLMSLIASAATAAPPGEVTLTVKQAFAVTGTAAPPSETFQYVLTPKEASSPMPVGSGPEGFALSVEGTDSILVGPIAFPRAGQYSYALRHATAPQPGYSYDQEVYAIEVFVKSDFSVSVVIYKSDGSKASDVKYAHAYGSGPLPSDPGVMVDPPVVKTVSGNPAKASVFTFRLMAGDPANPMPAGSENGAKTLRITGSGRGEFGTWSYTREGTYYYSITEVNTGLSGYSYDTAVYTITDSVKAVDGRLTVARVVTNGANKQVASLAFINIYAPGGGSTPPEGKPGSPNYPGKPGPITGDESRAALYIALFIAGSAVALGSAIYLITARRRREGKRL